ncbi:MAG: hypothetical protein LC138_08270, partial [Anaerolineales bacterium]|nr:hypothetical protein [Anaerolineales bacterium]
GLLSLDGRGFFPPIRTGKMTAIVDGRLGICGEGRLTFVETISKGWNDFNARSRENKNPEGMIYVMPSLRDWELPISSF